MNYSLRQAVDADYNFLYNLHRTTMREYIEPLWGWHEEWQKEYFHAKFDAAARQIIVIDGRDIGVVIVEDRLDEIYLSLIELLPDAQGRGVGTAIINRLIAQAHQSNRPLTLHVLKTNQPAQRLYDRLEFQVAGEEEHRYRMICPPGDNGSE